MGIDIGSSYTKITLVDEEERIVFRRILKTLNREKNILLKTLEYIYSRYQVQSICSTGYGREHFKDAHFHKTEIQCASVGVSKLFPSEKSIIDIGGEDIKIIKSSGEGKVEDFYMNTKCAAGTGTFITEIAERAEINLFKMSELAEKSDFDKELNSFCTVFAKTEIMKWIFDEVPVQDLARGIYISIVNRIAKLKIEKGIPVIAIGGVIAHHPYLVKILSAKFGQEVLAPKHPQMINSFGAAIMARAQSLKSINTYHA